MTRIQSRRNPLVLRARSLHASKGRDALGMHLAEGEKLVMEAADARMHIDTLFVQEGYKPRRSLPMTGATFTVTRAVIEAIATTTTPQGICAIVKSPRIAMPEQFPKGMLVMLDALQDPGNLGTILRTADAMGAGMVILGEGCADPFSPKCMRAAMGSTYHIPLAAGNLKEALQRLKDDGCCCICGHLQGVEGLPHLTDRCVIVIGNEGNGVDEDIAALCARVRLPMYGRAESLNASVAAGLLMYEAAKAIHNHS